MITTILFATIPLILYAVYLISKRKFRYWEKKKVPYIEPTAIFGNFAEYILQRTHMSKLEQKICKKFPNAPYVGAYYGTEPTLIVQDPDIIKLVITKDFYFFNGRDVSNYNHREPLLKILFFEHGDRWKVLRQNLTPLFSSAKMKNMFHLISNCSHVFENVLDKEVQETESVEARMLAAMFTMDCIGSCAFGIDTNTMVKKENNPFRRIGDVIFDTQRFRAFKLIVRSVWPAIFYAVGCKSMPQQVTKFFTELMTGIFKGRNYTPTTRNDFVDLVLMLKKNSTMTGDSMTNMKTGAGKKVNLDVDDDLLVAQCFLFFAAGYETSATTLSFTLFELAKHPEVQERLFEEVDSYLRRHNNVLKYECVAETPYMEACIDEALRLYPVLGVLTREVMEDYTFPTGLTVEKGLRVHLPLYHLHHNPEFFPEPEQYRPERFLGEEKQSIRPYTYMPFGDGPRICIGLRFARMQMAAGLITILKKYRVELVSGMQKQLTFEPKSIVTQPIGGIRLKFIEREGWEQRLFKSPVANACKSETP